MRRQMGHVFAGVRPAGAASGAPTEKNSNAAELGEPLHIRRLAEDEMRRDAKIVVGDEFHGECRGSRVSCH
jgi:hypothetical protein